jgi:hypothetical protein
MRSRAARIAVLLFQALWLNVILPGHRRGIVALPGSECESCRLACAPACHHSPGDSKDSVPVDPAAHCAICHFAAMLSLPPAIEVAPTTHRFLELRPAPIIERSASVPFPGTYDGRAPPALNFQPV